MILMMIKKEKRLIKIIIDSKFILILASCISLRRRTLSRKKESNKVALQLVIDDYTYCIVMKTQNHQQSKSSN